MRTVVYPPWAQELREVFRAETLNQFVLFGSINDYVAHRADGTVEFLPLREYLTRVLFAPFETVLVYDRSQGITVPRGAEKFQAFLSALDKYHGTKFSSDAGISASPSQALSMPGLLPRSPLQALDLIDRFINGIQAASRSASSLVPRSAAVIIDYAHFLAPRGESLHLSSDIGAVMIRLLEWAESRPAGAPNVVTCLLTENLLDLNELIVNSSYNAKVRIELPSRDEILEYVTDLAAREPGFGKLCQVEMPTMASKMVGLSRVAVRNTIMRGVRNNFPITEPFLTQLRRQSIEKESAGKLDFLESKRTLDDVAGHEEAKQWLRDDAHLIRKGATNAIPMGYLITGRIGTGKTYLVQCFSGECGIPFVELKNFREKWVGATEGNLEKIFSILHALGQVVVFVDEADQATGRRGGGDGDAGLSGRVYAMLAKEMSETNNRGKIIWIFATSRPDLLEVDLKRQGRLDVHIPLFPPVDKAEKQQFFLAMARKLKLNLTLEELPELPFDGPLGGNELEGLLVRAVRQYELQTGNTPKTLGQVLVDVVKEFTPSAHTAHLELMDLLAVKECTDTRFLPPRFASLTPAEVERRIAQLRIELGS